MPVKKCPLNLFAIVYAKYFKLSVHARYLLLYFKLASYRFTFLFFFLQNLPRENIMSSTNGVNEDASLNLTGEVEVRTL